MDQSGSAASENSMEMQWVTSSSPKQIKNYYRTVLLGGKWSSHMSGLHRPPTVRGRPSRVGVEVVDGDGDGDVESWTRGCGVDLDSDPAYRKQILFASLAACHASSTPGHRITRVGYL